jgi:hypothetical protein
MGKFKYLERRRAKLYARFKVIREIREKAEKGLIVLRERKPSLPRRKSPVEILVHD